MREREAHALMHRLDLFDGVETALGQPGQDAGDEILGYRGAARHADGADPGQPGLRHPRRVIDQIGSLGSRVKRHLHQPHRVRRVARADHDDQVRVSGDLLDRGLPVLGGVADVVAGRVEELREALPQRGYGLAGLIHRQGRLREPCHLRRVPHLDALAAGRAVHQVDAGGSLAGGADDLLVPFMPDEQDVVILRGKAPGLVVNLGDQRAGGVDGAQAAVCCLLMHLRRYPVRGKNHHRALRDFLGLLHEDRAALLQRPDHMGVMHDLLADVHRSPESLQRHLDRLDSPVDPGAVTAGLREQDTSGRHGHDTHRR